MGQARSEQAIKVVGKNGGSVFYCRERDNEANKIFIISLILEKKKPFQVNRGYIWTTRASKARTKRILLAYTKTVWSWLEEA